MSSGFLNIYKPLGITSHDVVAQIRRLYQRDIRSKKVGHAGTLDPLATGVLVICLGNATRLSEYVMHTQKTYHAHIKLGSVTTTYDAEGEIVRETPLQGLTCADVEAVLGQFVGNIQQVPPLYSAIKKDGKKLYELARAGETITIDPRSVHIQAIRVLSCELPLLSLEVVCSAGTYIRSLAYDIGEALGVGAHLAGLVRVTSGSFTLSNAHLLADVMQSDNWLSRVITPQEALSHYPHHTLTESEADSLRYGRAIACNLPYEGDVMGFLPDGELLAVLHADGTYLKPHKVFLS